MLIITRKKEQKIVVADDIEIIVLEVGRNRVRFGISAPKNVPVHTRLKTLPVPTEVTEALPTEARSSTTDASHGAAVKVKSS